jgi:hypothetical protein
MKYWKELRARLPMVRFPNKRQIKKKHCTGLRFFLTDFKAEQTEDIGMATVGFTWEVFYEFFAMTQDCLRRTTPGGRMEMDSID